MLPFLTKNLLSQRNPQCTSHLKPLDHHPTPPPHTHTHTPPFSGLTGAFTFMQVKVCPWG